MEVAGPPWQPTVKHTVGDMKKTLRTDILNLVSLLLNHLDTDIGLAAQLKVFCMQAISSRLTLYSTSMLSDGRFIVMELASCVMPFSFSARKQYKSVLRMMAILHDEFKKQEALLDEINYCVLRAKGTTVRHVLRVPEEKQIKKAMK
ncbi:6329_t:CDS:2 [Paraglomus occultum]|uniref:6329_t:CDS:1 n=1 Tax=Paraglomus occultum TaxID=144539 RepID=A0A9N9CQE2_9GLOM|nr:6329_t:CDS:2 [Paraglomus occultum]